MALKKILVPVDGSEGANAALDMAAKLADGNDDIKLDLIYVAPIPDLGDKITDSMQEVLDLMREDGADVLNEAVDYLGDAADKAEAFELSSTHVADEIIKMAEQGNYDLIVIGNRGLSGRQEYAGSVSYKVLHGSNIPVLIAK